jgi:hypothetical protein
LRRPKVIGELSTYLGILLRSGMRSGDEGDQGPIQLGAAKDIEGDGPTPAFFLHLARVVPDRRPAAPMSMVESGEAAHAIRREIRHPPLWVTCRYIVGVRGRNAEEDAELIAAALRALHDHRAVSPEHLPSIRQTAYSDRFPLDLVDPGDGCREAGLELPRPVAAFHVTVPIPSALSDPFERVLDREIRLEELP